MADPNHRIRNTAAAAGATLLAAALFGLAAPDEPDAPVPLPTDSSWSYEPIQRPPVPRVRDESWPASDIDRFILARLEAADLTPAPQADRRTLIRRATYDLTGLPPTPYEVDAFVTDDSPDAYQRLIDRLLASPQYGVKWGRHWLDLVRWAETDSYERDRVKPGAWRYRDWVIDVLNADMPYDQFLTMQLAGDELPDTSLGQHIATGYLHLGIRDDEPTDPLQAVYDDLDGMLDTTSRVMLGVSMGCVRCHDHKKDPISTREYYSLLSFFEGVKPYKVGGGNGINTGNFVRNLPADLGTTDWDNQLEQWTRDRAERLAEVENLMTEVRERWGGDALVAPAKSLAAGRVAHYSFDENEPLPDETFGVERTHGKLGAALAFDNNDQFLIDRPIAESFTISLWFRADAPGAGSETDLRWFLGSGLVDAEILGIVNDLGISLIGDRVAAGVGNPETFVSGPNGAADGDWHHVTFLRDAESGRIALWFDGVEADAAKGGTQPLGDAPKLSIGRLLPDRNTLRGAIDELAFWDRALTPREILDLAIGGGALPEHTALVAERLGPSEGQRLEAAVQRLLKLRRPTREYVEVLAAQEVDTPPQSFVRVRGMAAVKGDPVSRGFPRVLGGGAPQIVPPDDGETSGRRLALANWITAPDNPRTARVIANRLWQHHFGRGIVRSSNEFGELGELPTHPALLDHLATELVANGWRLKPMHKAIMMSAAYRMASTPTGPALDADPVNDLFTRFDPRRLTAEEIRDSILALNGSLNLEMGGPGVYPPMPEEVLATASRPDEAWGKSTPDQANRRSIYIHHKRSLLTPLLTSFDQADTDASCPVRFRTTLPTQALTMLNSDFINEQAAILAARIEREAGDAPESFATHGLRLTLTRDPDQSEVAEGVRLINDLQSADGLTPQAARQGFCLVLLNLNEFVYLD